MRSAPWSSSSPRGRTWRRPWDRTPTRRRWSGRCGSRWPITASTRSRAASAASLADLRERCARLIAGELGREVTVAQMMAAIRFRAFADAPAALDGLRTAACGWSASRTGTARCPRCSTAAGSAGASTRWSARRRPGRRSPIRGSSSSRSAGRLRSRGGAARRRHPRRGPRRGGRSRDPGAVARPRRCRWDRVAGSDPAPSAHVSYSPGQPPPPTTPPLSVPPGPVIAWPASRAAAGGPATSRSGS